MQGIKFQIIANKKIHGKILNAENKTLYIL